MDGYWTRKMVQEALDKMYIDTGKHPYMCINTHTHINRNTHIQTHTYTLTQVRCIHSIHTAHTYTCGEI